MAFLALLDACVLVPAALRDTLLRAAGAYLYRPLWSEEILAEVARALVRDLGKDPARVAYLLDEIREAFSEASVTGYQNLVPVMAVDDDDRHVAAAAVTGGAQVIVTSNLRDFPQAGLDPYSIEVQHPDQFLEQLFDLDAERMVAIVVQQANALSKPPRTPRDICANLRLRAPRFANLVERNLP